MEPEFPREEPRIERRVGLLEEREFDLLVVGGGINGTGIARDAARRGLSVALIEKEDFGYGTTGRSTRLIHGGLRYLAMLDLGLVRESLEERERLLRNAPHLVRPLPFLVPLYRGYTPPKFYLRMGLALYDLLGFDRTLPGHTFLSKREVLERVPYLEPEGLRGAFLYYDAQVALPERLCVENLLDACAHQAVVANHVQAIEILKEGTRVVGVRARDRFTGRELSIRSRTTVNATGPWLLTFDLRSDESRLRLTKGIHVLLPLPPEGMREAVVLFAHDGRLFFTIPWLSWRLVGTTDTSFEGDLDRVEATPEEVEYLLESARRFLPGLRWESIAFTTAGIRSLLRVEGVPEGAITRKHLILDHSKEGASGLWTVVGGKITPHRKVSEEVVDRIVRKLKVKRRSTTRKAPLPGAWGERERREWVEREGASGILPPEALRHLVDLYGRRAPLVVGLVREDPNLSQPLCPHGPTLRAEVVAVARWESAVTLADVLQRRTIASFSPCEGRDAAPPAAEILSKIFDWTPKRIEEELRGYEETLRLRHGHEKAMPAEPDQRLP